MSRRLVTGAVIGGAVLVCLSGCKAVDEEGGAAPRDGRRLSAAQVVELTSEKAGKLDTFAADIVETGTADGKTTRLAGTFRFRSKPDPAVSADFSQLQYGGTNVSGRGQVVILDDVLYLRLPVISQFLSGGRPWFRVPLGGLQRVTGVNAAAVVSSLMATTPEKVTKMFTASKNVHAVGTETVEGATTIHYRGSVSAQSALAELDSEDRARLEKSYGIYGSDTAGTISFDLWVDDRRLPRRSAYSLRGTNTPTSTTITYHYGRRFTVTAPPASQVGGIR
ncbi:hypothetical protein ACRYCC_37495 [Actinomadura scrupuli]|uniref:hypothetical protein n=1 Tax=Actinomadura scrupuli TaxID=559629 RepID=UPI003D998148